MIKLSIIFAMWEICKAFIGPDFWREKPAPPGVVAAAVFMELPYLAWGIWLTFNAIVPAAILWAIGLAFVVLDIKKNYRTYNILYVPNCLVSAGILTAVFMGWRG